MTAEDTEDTSIENGAGDAIQEWKSVFVTKLIPGVTTSSVNERIHLFETTLLPLIKRHVMPSVFWPKFLNIMSLTVVRYQDKRSRQAVESALKAIMSSNPKSEVQEFRSALTKIISKLNAELIRPATVDASSFVSPPYTRLTLLSWTCALIENVFISNATVNPVDVNDMVELLTIQYDSLQGEQACHRHLDLSSRARLNSMLTKFPEAIDVLMRALLSCTQVQGFHLNLLAAILSYSGKEKLSNMGETILKIYVDVILNARVKMPEHQKTAFKKVFKVFSLEAIDQYILPGVPKLLLRNPEFVLNSLSALFEAVQFDLSHAFAQLSEPLFNQLKSTNAIVRGDALRLIECFSSKSTSSETIAEVTKCLLKLAEQKAMSVDYKIAVFKAIAVLPANEATCKSVVESMSAFCKKECTEIVLPFELDALVRHASICEPSYWLRTFVDGLSSTKDTTRCLYFQALTHLRSNCIASEKSLASQFYDILEKITESPSSTSPIELFFAASIILTFNDPTFIGKRKAFVSRQLSLTDRGVLTPRSYLKITKSIDAVVNCWRAFTDNVALALTPNHLSQLFYGMIWAVRQKSCVEGQRQALALFDIIFTTTENKVVMSKALLEAARKTVEEADANVIGEEMRIHLKIALHRIITKLMLSLCLNQNDIDKELGQTLLSFSLVVNYPLIGDPDIYSWPSYINRIENSDGEVLQPSFLVETFGGELISSWTTDFRSMSNNLRKAALTSISNFVLVSSDKVVPLLLDLLSKMAHVDKIPTSTELAIWKTPEDQTFIDGNPIHIYRMRPFLVLKKNVGNDKSGNATEKWEKELREELAAKQKGRKNVNLTKEEQLAIKEQLKVESDVRKSVADLYQIQIYVVQVVQAILLAASPDDFHFLPNVFRILLVVMQTSQQILEESKCLDWDCYEYAMGLVPDLCVKFLGELRKVSLTWLMATFRLTGFKFVPLDFCQVSVKDQCATLVDFVLDIVKEMQTPLSVPIFGTCFPLLNLFIRGGSLKSDKIQIDGAMELLSLHASLADSQYFPRKEVIQLLIFVIETFPVFAKTGHATLIEMAGAIGDSAKEEELWPLVDGLLSAESSVRHACLLALELMDIKEATAASYAARLWICCHDSNAAISSSAEYLWEGSEIGPRFREFLIPQLLSRAYDVRENSARAIAAALKIHPSSGHDTLIELYQTYKELTKPPEPVFDDYGIALRSDVIDTSYARSGVVSALQCCASSITYEELLSFFNVLIYDPSVLADDDEDVRAKALNAGLNAIDAHGKERLSEIITIFNRYLDAPAENSLKHDCVRAAVVVMLGGAAKHLNSNDPTLPSIFDKLVACLNIPSESVQYAVGSCIPHLVTKRKETIQPIMDKVLEMTINGTSYAIRRGGAYGVAGIVKGYGIGAFKKFGLIDWLSTAAEDKKRYESREGALFVYETLAILTGRFIEPYLMLLLPDLLRSFGDASNQVRQAALDASKVIMAVLSSQCLKRLLPVVLKGLEDTKWRTKVGSVEVLGAMAYCAPQQLSISLPVILPKLSDVLTDSHTSVRAAGEVALMRFTEVINNPEIKFLSPVLLKALGDPTKYAMDALSALISTPFAHYIDGPSLALVIPLIERGLKERNTELKKKAAQIVGSIASLTEPTDLIPYLDTLIPLVREVLVDPVPEARTISAKALGSIMERLGENSLPTLVDELLDMLRHDVGGVDRQGAAQGLAEVIHGLGIERLDDVMPEVISSTDSAKPNVREGFMNLIIFLPTSFGDAFQKYLAQVIPCVLKGLADEYEYVRDAALKSGQVIVNRFARSAIDLLLPKLQEGLFDVNWRIRQTSVRLMGELLFKIAGITSNIFSISQDNVVIPDDNQENENEHGRKAIISLLGSERFNTVLAALYIVRGDSNASVRLASIHVWKGLVQNTPRTLKEILPAMIEIIVKCLGSPAAEKRDVAAVTLGDLVNKLGEFILSEIVPNLKMQLNSSDDHVRQGVCIGLIQIVQSTSKQHVEDHRDDLIACVQRALCDPVCEVREAAAQAFDTLHNQLGSALVDEVLPNLLVDLQQNAEKSTALNALKELMTIRSHIVFPVLIPTLLTKPITAFHAKALGSLIKVAKSAISQQVTPIMNTLMDELTTSGSTEVKKEIEHTLQIILESVEKAEAIHSLMMTLFEWIKFDVSKRIVACKVIALFCAINNSASIANYIGDWIAITVDQFDLSTASGSQELVSVSWEALDSLVKRIKKDELQLYVMPMRRSLQSLISDMKARNLDRVDGFNLPKGIQPFLTMFLHGLMYGNVEVRENAASGIGDLISFTDVGSLKPFIMQITGPFIRIVGDKVSWQVKSSLLDDLALLMRKVGNGLKAFLPQLQRTFVRCLTEENSTVRQKAVLALRELIALQPQIEPLLKDLEKALKESSGSVLCSLLNALWLVLDQTGSRLSPSTHEQIQKTVNSASLLCNSVTEVRLNAALCRGAFVTRLCDKDSALSSISSFLELATDVGNTEQLQSVLVTLDAIIALNDEVAILSPRKQDQIAAVVVDMLLRCIDDNRFAISEVALRAAGRWLYSDQNVEDAATYDLFLPALCLVLKDKPADSKRMVLIILQAIASKPKVLVLLKTHFGTLIPLVLQLVRERNIPVKLAAEKALLALLRSEEDTDDGLNECLQVLNPNDARQLSDYYRRVLTKLIAAEKERKRNPDERNKDNEDIVLITTRPMPA